MSKKGRQRIETEQSCLQSGGVRGPSENLLWGINAVKEKIVHNPQKISEILVQKGKSGPRLQRIIDLARLQHIRLRFVASQRLGVPDGCKHQGIVAKQSMVSCLSLDDLLEIINRRTSKTPVRLLALDSIQDPHNMGAILRSALAAGFEAVIIPRERSASLGGTVAKVSAGAVVRLPVCRVVNLAESLRVLKKKDIWIFGAIADGNAVSLYEADFSAGLCLVIGGEKKGIRPLIRKQCDYLVRIPMQADFDSLNASVAAAVFMFEIVRRQIKSAGDTR